MANYYLNIEEIKKDLTKKIEKLKKEISIISSLNINTKKDGSDFQNLKKALTNETKVLGVYGSHATDEEIEEHNQGIKENAKRGYISYVGCNSNYLYLRKITSTEHDTTGNNDARILFYKPRYDTDVQIIIKDCQTVQDVREKLADIVEFKKQQINNLKEDKKNISKIYNKFLEAFDKLDKTEKLHDRDAREKLAEQFNLKSYAACLY